MNDFKVLIPTIMPFEVKGICKKLEQEHIRFMITPMGTNDAGLLDVRSNNVAAALTNIADAFSHGGTSIGYQVSVHPDDYEKAKEIVDNADFVQEDISPPPPESAFTDPEPEFEKAKVPRGIWGWNTIPILNLVAIVVSTFFAATTYYFPMFFNGCKSFGCFVAIELAFNLFIATVAVYALILVAKRSMTYPSLTTKLFWICAVGNIVNLIVARHFNVEISTSEALGMIRGTAFAMIWMAYFSGSARIKNTFVNAPMPLRKVFVTSAIVIAFSALFCWIRCVSIY